MKALSSWHPLFAVARVSLLTNPWIDSLLSYYVLDVGGNKQCCQTLGANVKKSMGHRITSLHNSTWIVCKRAVYSPLFLYPSPMVAILLSLWTIFLFLLNLFDNERTTLSMFWSDDRSCVYYIFPGPHPDARLTSHSYHIPYYSIPCWFVKNSGVKTHPFPHQSSPHTVGVQLVTSF